MWSRYGVPCPGGAPVKYLSYQSGCGDEKEVFIMEEMKPVVLKCEFPLMVPPRFTDAIKHAYMTLLSCDIRPCRPMRIHATLDIGNHGSLKVEVSGMLNGIPPPITGLFLYATRRTSDSYHTTSRQKDFQSLPVSTTPDLSLSRIFLLLCEAFVEWEDVIMECDPLCPIDIYLVSYFPGMYPFYRLECYIGHRVEDERR
jgi:hypothetical protein